MKNLIALFLILALSAPAFGQKNYSTEGKKAIVTTTAANTDLRLKTDAAPLVFKEKKQPTEGEISVFVNPDQTFQTVTGIGGAVTDAVAETFAKLPLQKQKEVLDVYFHPEKGIGYSFARTTIHSCDFSSASYTYVAEGDADLKTFSIDHDKQFRIPFLKQAISAAGGKLTLFASPWSPPAFMKTNNSMLQGGKLKPEFNQSWANYFTKFVKAYEKEGIPIWGISVQNEPMATQRWESCIFTAEEERDFLKKFLGPTMKKEGLGDKKIIVWDHNRDMIYQRASVMMNDPEAAKYVWGIGFHWYENWSGGQNMFDNVKLVHESYPKVNLLFTEGCKEGFVYEKMNDWSLGEKYGTNMIQDFNSGVVAWTDWNMLLDETGGPNHVQNFVFAPIHADLRTKELIYTNEFYYIGHFSKFVRPGAKRIAASPSRSAIETTAFINTDGKIAVIVMNKGETELTYNLWIGGNAVEIKSLPRSIQTVVIYNQVSRPKGR